MYHFRRTLIVGLAVAAFAMSVAAQTNQQVEKSFLGHLTNLKRLSGQTDGADRIERENKALIREFVKFGKRLSMLKYDFSKLGKVMSITTSPDGKFRIYSWDNQYGGTMRDHENIFQYQAANGKVFVKLAPRSNDGDMHGFFHQVFQIDTPGGRVYLANSTFIASTSSASQDLTTFRIDGAKLNTNVRLFRTKRGLTNSISFAYDFFSVVDRPERPVKLFFFDVAKRSFRFPVVIADDTMPQGRVTDKIITYRFDGKYFVKTR